jgi:hypothetical protein
MRVLETLRALPNDFVIDPLVLAKKTGLDEVHTLAALGVLMQAHLGAFVIQIVDRTGRSVAEYPSLHETPESVPDDFGDQVVVEPSNTRIVFRPNLA